MSKQKFSKEFLRNKPQNVLLFKRAVDELVPKVYAGFVLALHEQGMSFEEIVAALQTTQEYWQSNSDIVHECEQITGINVMSAVTAQELQAEGDAVI